MLSDQQMCEDFDKAEIFQRFSSHFCFEPLALAACRINTWVVLLNGGRVDCFSGNFNEFWNELRLSSPHWFSAAPRIWNWLYSIFKGRVQALIREGKEETEATETAAIETREMMGKRCELVQTVQTHTLFKCVLTHF
jgi:long-subunit acyl-CoA synthetase (AMP-forming)